MAVRELNGEDGQLPASRINESVVIFLPSLDSDDLAQQELTRLRELLNGGSGFEVSWPPGSYVVSSNPPLTFCGVKQLADLQDPAWEHNSPVQVMGATEHPAYMGIYRCGNRNHVVWLITDDFRYRPVQP